MTNIISGTAAAVIEPFITGTLTADGTEQDVANQVTPFKTLEGYIDLSNMQLGDTVILREYIIASDGGSFALYGQSTYTNAQSQPLIHFPRLPNQFGIKVTLEQTAGTNRDFPYDFVQGVI